MLITPLTLLRHFHAPRLIFTPDDAAATLPFFATLDDAICFATAMRRELRCRCAAVDFRHA